MLELSNNLWTCLQDIVCFKRHVTIFGEGKRAYVVSVG